MKTPRKGPGVSLESLKGQIYSDPEAEARKAARQEFMYRELNQFLTEEEFWAEGGPDQGPRNPRIPPPTMRVPGRKQKGWKVRE